ncbi:MAG: hypothetical protein CM1200mP1_09720 [Candidatus Neomarinimicrobiota bacterium]|nr:MAG: hypothetical protein CM1200mP1_09720 [Candidatus Neomarinimicrobiota bacterium]
MEQEVRTIIPSFALAEIDVRLVKETDAKRMVKLIKNHIKSEGYYIIEVIQLMHKDLNIIKLLHLNIELVTQHLGPP